MTTLDRRRFIAAAAATGATSWAAPSVLRVDSAAAAPGSCLPDSLVWSNQSFRLDDLPAYTGSETAIVSSMLATIGVTAQFYGGPAPGGWGAVEPSSGSSGGNSGHLRVPLDDATPIGGFIDVTLSFAPEVYDLAFTISDIDAFWRRWRDQVTIVSASGSAGPAPYTFSTAPVSVVVGTGTVADPFIAQCRKGFPEKRKNCRPAVNSNENLGNVSMYLAGPVQNVTVRYTAGPPPGGGSWTGAVVGISDLTFCVLPSSEIGARTEAATTPELLLPRGGAGPRGDQPGDRTAGAMGATEEE